jgi:peptide deformylase
MAIKTILKHPDPRLREVSQRVPKPDAVRDLVEDMAETMYAASGVGLAAIQVGEPLRLFIVDSVLAGGNEQDPPLVFIDPEIIETSPKKETIEEGCLSLPGIFLPLARFFRARIRATNEDGGDLRTRCREDLCQSPPARDGPPGGQADHRPRGPHQASARRAQAESGHQRTPWTIGARPKNVLQEMIQVSLGNAG